MMIFDLTILIRDNKQLCYSSTAIKTAVHALDFDVTIVGFTRIAVNFKFHSWFRK